MTNLDRAKAIIRFLESIPEEYRHYSWKNDLGFIKWRVSLNYDDPDDINHEHLESTIKLFYKRCGQGLRTYK